MNAIVLLLMLRKINSHTLGGNVHKHMHYGKSTKFHPKSLKIELTLSCKHALSGIAFV
jgi:hypothetical protein